MEGRSRELPGPLHPQNDSFTFFSPKLVLPQGGQPSLSTPWLQFARPISIMLCSFRLPDHDLRPSFIISLLVQDSPTNQWPPLSKGEDIDSFGPGGSVATSYRNR